MRNALSIRAGGAVIRGVPTHAHPWGLFVKRNGFQGWEGIADRRRDQVARAVEHGEHDVPVYLGARVATIDGWIIAQNERELREWAQQVVGLGADGQRLAVTVDHQQQTLWARGRVVSATADDAGERHGWYIRASFQIQVVFADPRKYGSLESFPTSGYQTISDVYQRGNFPAHPAIVFGSGPSSWSCTASGRSLQVSGMTSGGAVRFDMRTGRITRNGVDVTDSATITGDIWAVPVGVRWRHELSVPGRILLPETYV